MSKINLELELDTNNKTHMLSASIFFSSLAGEEVPALTAKTSAPVMELKVEAAEEITQDAVKETPAGPAPSHESVNWTIEDMKVMSVKDLKPVCDALGIDYASLDGMNNNKKLRELIFSFHNSGAAQPAAQPEQALGEKITEAKGLIAGIQDKQPLKKKLKEIGAAKISAMTMEQADGFISWLKAEYQN